MLKKYPQFHFGFAIIFVFQLLATGNGLRELSFFTKPMITILLMSFIMVTIKHKGRFAIRMLIGLFFSLLGDIALLFTNESQLFFIMALVAFMFTHVAYANAFYLDYTKKKAGSSALILLACGGFGTFTISYYLFLCPYLFELAKPVLLYCTVITVMTVLAVARIGRCNSTSFNYVFCASVLFYVSDAMLAYEKFIGKFTFGGVLVMATYMGAQYAFTIGTVERRQRRATSIVKD